MPVDLETPYKRLLLDIVTISQGIRNSALEYASSQNFHVSQRLRCQLERIRLSADTIAEAFNEASLTNHTLDERLINWLTSTGELQLCLRKLKEMEDMMKPVGRVRPARASARPFRPIEDKLTPVLVFFDKHSSLFHFFLSPDIW